MSAELQEQRLAVVREHMQSENTHDFDRTIATFARPRYELMATDEIFDGEAEMRAYYARSAMGTRPSDKGPDEFR